MNIYFDFKSDIKIFAFLPISPGIDFPLIWFFCADFLNAAENILPKSASRKTVGSPTQDISDEPYLETLQNSIALKQTLESLSL